MKRRLVKWAIYSMGFAMISIPIHMEIESTVWTWLSVSIIIGFFAGIFNEILIQMKKKDEG